MTRRPTLKQQLEALLEQFIPDIRSAFLASIQDVVDNAVLKDVIAAIELGDAEKAFRSLGFSDAAMRPLTASIERAFETGGITVGNSFPRASGRTVFRFDVRNSRAEKWLRDQSSGLVSRVTEDARVSVRNVLQRGVAAGDNPRRTALDIVGRLDPASGRRSGGVLGLTPNQEGWVSRTRRQLVELDQRYFDRALRDKRFDRTVAKAIRDGKALPAEVIDKLVDRYKDNALKYRGDTIARTESISALNRSEYEAIKQATETGAVANSAVQRVWDSAGDNRVRDSHAEMDGQSVGLDEPFRTPGGASLMFPGDTSLGAPPEETIQCRCRVRLAVDWLADID